MKKNSSLIFILLFILVIWFVFFYSKKNPSEVTNITYTNSSADIIVVDSPLPNSVVGKDFSITGKARGNWFFEASFPIQVLDKDGKNISQAIAEAKSDWMTTDFVPFKADVKLPESYAGPATLVFKKDNPSGLPEHDASVSFSVIKNKTNDLTQVYRNELFSVEYPNDFNVDYNYKYQLNPEKNISGIKFTIPPSLTTGTNLSSDSYISVESITKTKSCTANLFLDQKANITTYTTTDKNVTYSVASSTGAGAGNRYEETVYAISGSDPCIAVRYFIHYGAIENYSEGAVKEFDKQTLINKFNAIRRSLILAH